MVRDRTELRRVLRACVPLGVPRVARRPDLLRRHPEAASDHGTAVDNRAHRHVERLDRRPVPDGSRRPIRRPPRLRRAEDARVRVAGCVGATGCAAGRPRIPRPGPQAELVRPAANHALLRWIHDQ